MLIAPVLASALFSVSPCTYAKRAARCGYLTVPENRTTNSGRTIDVHFVVVPARSKQPKEPLFFVAGGPGQSVIQDGAGFIAAIPFFADVYRTRERDIVLVDQRGTGKSHALNCRLFPTDASAYQALFPIDRIRKCRNDLAKTSDLGAYGSAAASDDLNDVRAHLGYEKIVLFGGSYGTTESLIYIRRHGGSVKAAILEGVAPPWLLLPKPFPRGGQNALTDLERSCAADALCSTRYPKFSHEFDSVLARSKHGIPVDGGTISFPVFADRMRQAMYDPSAAAFLPLIVHRAATGDVVPLGKFIALASHYIDSDAMGMNLSVTCSESLPFITDADARAAAAGTFMGVSRYRAQRAACDVWKVRPAPRTFLDPIRSTVPVLMVGGEKDPATPPQFGSQELRYLPNGRQVLVPHGGHDIGDSCVAGFEMQFLATYSVKNLDTRCLKGAKRPPFATNLKPLGL
jgi:pimeloyl-ACP methyl ester carboxylesterase